VQELLRFTHFVKNLFGENHKRLLKISEDHFVKCMVYWGMEVGTSNYSISCLVRQFFFNNSKKKLKIFEHFWFNPSQLFEDKNSKLLNYKTVEVNLNSNKV